MQTIGDATALSPMELYREFTFLRINDLSDKLKDLSASEKFGADTRE